MSDLAEKLGLKEGMTAFVMFEPVGYAIMAKSVSDFSDIPDNVDWIQAFFEESEVMYDVIGELAGKLQKSGQLWISWPKKASGIRSDLSDNLVRTAGLSVGLVDVKVASITDVWSGIKFVYRLADR